MNAERRRVRRIAGLLSRSREFLEAYRVSRSSFRIPGIFDFGFRSLGSWCQV